MLIRSASGLRGIVKNDFSPQMIDQYIAWMQDPKEVGGESAPDKPKQIPPSK